jgi:DNA-binding CsgD family transcriptional regulator
MHLSDARNKATALARIKRLSSSGLPLEPFVHGIFDLINDGVPHSPNRAIHAGAPDQVDAFICSTPEVRAIVPAHRRYYTESAPEVSGARVRLDTSTLKNLLVSKTVWRHEEVAREDFLRAEGFNEVFRPLGYHHSLIAVFQEAGNYLGYFPIWRSSEQKRYSREDIQFLRESAPHIAHGLRAAQLLSRDTTVDAASFAPLPGWGAGMVLMDTAGNPIAMDATARLIFEQLGVFDGLRGDAFGSKPVQDALDYIARTLRGIFRDSGSAPTTLVPVCRVKLHWTGIALRVRGVMMPAADGREYVGVLIERGESAENRHRRMMARWGLSHREAEVLGYIAQGKTGPEISILLAISHDTVRRHTGNIFQKLGVETRTAAAALALEAGQLPTS